MIALSKTIPTNIIVGPHEQTAAAVLDFFKKLWCKTSSDSCFCNTCKQLSHHQHHFLAWIAPTKDYTVDDLGPLFSTTALALDDGVGFYFVLEHTEKLTASTANRLLKLLEEPPVGYHFILLTDNLSALLPTIVSRSEVMTLIPQYTLPPHPLVEFFARGATLEQVSEFESTLSGLKLSDSASLQVLDELFAHLEEQLVIAVKKNAFDVQDNLVIQLTFIKKAMATPPQSGSSDLFWKNLWVNFPRL